MSQSHFTTASEKALRIADTVIAKAAEKGHGYTRPIVAAPFPSSAHRTADTLPLSLYPQGLPSIGVTLACYPDGETLIETSVPYSLTRRRDLAEADAATLILEALN